MTDLYLMPMDGGPLRSLAAQAVTPSWMPDGDEIVFSSFFEGRVWRIPVAGGIPQAVTTSAERASNPAVARRGHRLAFDVFENRMSLWRVDLTRTIPPVAGQPVRLENTTVLQYDPSFSPDGNRIAFGSDRTGSGELWLDDAQGGAAVQLTKFGSSNPGLSPLVSRWLLDRF
ncbi:MAG: hypothetical protein WBW33_15275 [Bryobacteraceae bacterium]